ncbi:DUF1499 domain-containing protein [Maribrevibacterium harenarium]|uniref:DUF1499 domain-containing protein n=1 Tax=Maribrevibacterium harenarium TaxID=2589817 RepID=A0A501X2M9_9GAMM|nr:DUF1499 domain-containing protein [Maribrevibacterium harenarium]TPE54746.1 DUF1499 domain-containing protein [Maribrevibacterium harenarium]
MGLLRWILVAIIAMGIGFFVYVDMNSAVPDNLGMVDGSFTPCPPTPNCVSSMAQADDEQHYVEPIIYRGSLRETQLKIEAYFLNSGHAKLLNSHLGYAHFEITTPLLGFKDDIEIYLPEADQVVHVRSASRVGYDDLGENRKRLRQLRELLVD